MFMKAAEKIGRVSNSAEKYEEQLTEAGFVDIHVEVYKWPQNRWPKNPRYKELGESFFRVGNL